MAWQDLTDRQKELDRRIENCGINLNDSILTTARIMIAIGASYSEKDFVKERIRKRLQTQKLLEETDSFINKTERMLKQFEED